MNETNKGNESPETLQQLHEKLGADYSYLDYLIERQYFRAWTRLGKWIWAIVTGVLIWIAFWGFNNAQDYLRLSEKAEQALAEYRQLDSLNQIREENGEYYAFWLQLEADVISPPVHFRSVIDKRIQDAGFSRFVPPRTEDELNIWLYVEGKIDFNLGTDTISALHRNDALRGRPVVLMYHQLPKNIRQRLEQVFKDTYAYTDFIYIEDSTLPPRGCLYYVLHEY